MAIVTSTSFDVVLVGVPAIFGHGLQHALSADGVAVVQMADMDGTLPLASSESLCLFVALEEMTAHVRHVIESRARAGPAAVVHVVPALDEVTVAGALHSGAAGVLALDADLETAVDVVRAAVAGRVSLPEEVLQGLTSHRAVADEVPPLGPRDREWLRGLSRGETVSGLARAAAYSEREMYRQLAAMYTRLGARSRTEALLRAARWGLLDE